MFVPLTNIWRNIKTSSWRRSNILNSWSLLLWCWHMYQTQEMIYDVWLIPWRVLLLLYFFPKTITHIWGKICLCQGNGYPRFGRFFKITELYQKFPGSVLPMYSRVLLKLSNFWILQLCVRSSQWIPIYTYICLSLESGYRIPSPAVTYLSNISSPIVGVQKR